MKKLNYNSGVIRYLKSLKESSSEGHSSLLISLFALLISMASLYFQFFYENYDLNACLISSKVNTDSLMFDIIYHNKGNQDATIINSDIFFYTDLNKEKKENHFTFINDDELNEPYILSSGKQVFYKLKEYLYFDENDLSKFKSNLNDTIRIELKISFLNNNTLESENNINCGWILLDSSYNIKYYKINYMKINLKSDMYFIGNSLEK